MKEQSKSITPRAQDFAAWYQDVVMQGDMAEPAEVPRGRYAAYRDRTRRLT